MNIRDKKEQSTELYWHIIHWYQEHQDVDRKDFLKMLASVFENFAAADSDIKRDESVWDDRCVIPKTDVNDFREMWEGFMQQTIDFINSHPKTKERLEEIKKQKQEAWNTKYNTNLFHPDIRIAFGADCLEESIKAGKWVSATDSYCDLRVADHSVLSMI